MARLARVYSVAVPAVLFSVVVAVGLGQSVNAWDVASSFLFLNESWLNPAALPMNGPYWSLCYEVWYYLLFGMAIFLPRRFRWTCVVVAAIAGPAILLLMPIWLLGTQLARSPSLLFKSKHLALGAAIFGLLIIVAMGKMGSGIDVSLRIALKEQIPGFWRLVSSQRFLTDYIIALAFALHLIGIRSIIERFSDNILTIEKPIRFFAGSTFSIYLFHRPITEVIGRIWPNESQSILASLVAFAFILGMCLLAAHLTEHRVAAWRSLFISNVFRPWTRSTWRSYLRRIHVQPRR